MRRLTSLVHRPSLLVALALTAIASVGCRDVQVVDGTGGTSSSSASASHASSSVVTTPTMNTASSSAGTFVCGGKAGTPCPPQMYCDFANGSCGGADEEGVCSPMPMGCPADCPGVCGCGGQFYCNACVAASQGVDVSSSTSCLPDGGEYSAEVWIGDLNHLTIRKADKARDICIEIEMDSPSMEGDPFFISAPQAFATSYAMIMKGASNCLNESAPDPEVIAASSGKGAVDWALGPNMMLPCELSVNVELAFNNPPPWVQPVETLNAMHVAVSGGCQ